MTNYYPLSSLVAFILAGMGFITFLLGLLSYRENKQSRVGLAMFRVCICVFLWNFGYAWMSLCYNSSFAIYPRAIGLVGISTYLFFIIRFIAELADYPTKRLVPFLVFYVSTAGVSLIKIALPSAVNFKTTPWGYWYTSNATWGRALQFIAIASALTMFYVILIYWQKKEPLKRYQFIIRRFVWFGVILFTGYALDTMIPTIFKIDVFPFSDFAAFFSVMLLYGISRKYKAFGASIPNVSKYVFKDVTVPVLVFDHEGNMVLFNDVAPAYFNKSAEDLILCKSDDLIDKNIFISGEYDSLEGADELCRVKGTDSICKYKKTEVMDEFGELQYKIAFIQDMTIEQKAMVAMNEGKLAAEQANMAKTNFLANMSHEIRTPMNAIIGMSDIILHNESINDETRNQISEIKAAGNGLLGIINDILDISKIEAGRYEIVEDEYELPSLIHDLSNIINIKLMETQVKFALSVDPTLPHNLYGDMTRVKQILLNILGNAVKFTNAGTIRFSITWDKSQIEPELQFIVKDSGIGIKREDLTSIFEAFKQVDTRRNRNLQGTGLGLAISKQLAQLMNGDIEVESLYGVGSTFKIRIKQRIPKYIEIGEKVAIALENNQYLLHDDSNVSGVTKHPDAKILVVDDNRVNLTVAAGLMKFYDIKIDTAISGAKALDMVQEKDYDIVFMDHMMPDMDGIDTTRAIRALGGKFKDLTIIALTANAIDEARELFLREGLQDFLSKPIERKALTEMLDKWLP